MDQKRIVLHLGLKRLSAHPIHDNLVATFGPRAVAQSTMICYLREVKLGTPEVALDPE
jgi:hypothetical protein